jgi:hypothetical protein
MVERIKMKHLLPILFCSLVFVSNWLIFSSTTEKINQYKHVPPFPAYDFTNSSSRIFHLLDGDHTTYWIKEREAGEWDFDLELRFSHVLRQKNYKPLSFSELVVVPCEGYPPITLTLELIRREGINVDKELRMPKQEILESIFLTNVKEPLIYDVSKHFLDKEVKLEYDGLQMYILGIRGRVSALSGKPCLAEVELKE